LSELAADPGVPPLILVTHHLEEIPVGVTHVALLRAGAMVESGPVEIVLRSEAVSAAFGIDVVVERRRGRWSARASTG
jgi:iron complex transport system ATP-binding protein